MIDFDKIVLYPGYSDIESRSEVNPYINIASRGLKNKLPIIVANMASLYSSDFIKFLNKNQIITSVPRIGYNVTNELNNMPQDMWPFVSISAKSEFYPFLDTLKDKKVHLLIDVNHGYHKNVMNTLQHIQDMKKDGAFQSSLLMVGNVSSIDGIVALFDWGADIVKVGNSFGSACSTLIKTGFGVHGLHVCKQFYDSGLRDEYYLNKKYICLDGGIRCIGDIAKALIYSDMVMIGKMFAGTTESGCEFVDDMKYKRYFGNASYDAKVMDGKEKPEHVEGQAIFIPHTGSALNLIQNIKEGLQSAFSFIGARDLKEYQRNAGNYIEVL